MLYVLRARSLTNELRGVWPASCWKGVLKSEGLSPGDLVTLTSPPVRSLDGTGRMSMTVERGQRTGPGFGRCSEPIMTASAGVVQIMLKDTACSWTGLRLKQAEAAALMPPNSQVLSYISGASALYFEHDLAAACDTCAKFPPLQTRSEAQNCPV